MYRTQRVDERKIWLASSLGVLFGHILLIVSLYWINTTSIRKPPTTHLRVHMSSHQTTASQSSLKEAVATSAKIIQQAPPAKHSPEVALKTPLKKTSNAKNPEPANTISAVHTPPTPMVTAPKPTTIPTKSSIKPAATVVAKTTTAKTHAPSAAPAVTTSPTNQAKVTEQVLAKQRLLAQVQQTLADSNQAAITTKSSNTVANHSLTDSWSSSIELPSSSLSVREKASNYDEILSCSLRQSVILPEHGTVDISLTLDRDGCITKYTIIGTTSTRNSAYVANKLSQLQLPAWPAYLSDMNEYTVCCKLTTHT